MLNLRRESLYDAIMSTNGGIFTVKFRKKDGQERVINCRLGVKSYLHGGVATVRNDGHPYIIAFDLKAKGYRCINLYTTSQLRAGGAEFRIIG